MSGDTVFFGFLVLVGVGWAVKSAWNAAAGNAKAEALKAKATEAGVAWLLRKFFGK